ncbi:hypothetical protein [Tumebacillus permanentifrigoris]|uniref:hypothetical protein n=1 Tax=Tumebacillus permanentifrigoris TaxID=378543 RepID=UPI001473DCEA|nr:hypothetical protein [Tumebacillus permanentifrigoris]
MSYQPNTDNLQALEAPQQVDCSRVATNALFAQLEGFEGELVGHERNGHARAHLGRSFGRPEGEIREDIEEVTAQLQQCHL